MWRMIRIESPFSWRSVENSQRTKWICYGLAFYGLHFVAETLYCPFEVQIEPRVKEIGKLFLLLQLLLMDWRQKKKFFYRESRKKSSDFYMRDGSSSFEKRRFRHLNVNVNHWSVSTGSRSSSAQIGEWFGNRRQKRTKQLESGLLRVELEWVLSSKLVSIINNYRDFRLRYTVYQLPLEQRWWPIKRARCG